jgi:hypothetical protein
MKVTNDGGTEIRECLPECCILTAKSRITVGEQATLAL